MNMKTGEVLAEVGLERHRQDQKWGGPAHDDKHTTMQWIEFIETKADQAYEAAPFPNVSNDDKARYRERMIQIAALAVAAVESLDRQMETN